MYTHTLSYLLPFSTKDSRKGQSTQHFAFVISLNFLVDLSLLKG